MALIETFSKYGSGRNVWLNVSGGAGNETLTGLTVASSSNVGQCIAIRMVLENGTPVPLLNPRELRPFKSTRIRLPAIFLKQGQRIECYSSEYADFNMTLMRVNGGRPGTNRVSLTPTVGEWSAISPPGAPMEITSVVCVNKTEARGRVALRFRNDPGGSAGNYFLDEIVPPGATYRGTFSNDRVLGTQWLDVFSTCDCAWVISGVCA